MKRLASLAITVAAVVVGIAVGAAVGARARYEGSQGDMATLSAFYWLLLLGGAIVVSALIAAVARWRSRSRLAWAAGGLAIGLLLGTVAGMTLGPTEQLTSLGSEVVEALLG